MPNAAQIHTQLLEGLAQQQAGELSQAQDTYRQVLKRDPKNFDALHLLGVIAAQTKDFAESVKLISRAITVNPGNATAHYNRGIALDELRQYQAAVASYDKAIKLNPVHAIAHNNRGVALNCLKLHGDAVASFDKAIALQPDYAEAYNNRGYALSDMGQYEAAIASFDEALRLKPDYPDLAGTRLYTKMRICDWRDVTSEINALEKKIARGERAATPWPVLALTDDPALQYKAAATWAAAMHPANAVLGDIPRRARGAKIKIGYFSMDFREHPVPELTARLFELHDRTAFEIYAFSYGPDTKDAMRKRLQKAFDAFIDVREKSDQDVAALARSMGIDIAVDLAGYTTDARCGVMALRAAPIQVSYLGYAASVAVPYIDYIVADRHVIPDAHRQFYAEKMAYLPCYQAADNTRLIAERQLTREELGLPSSGFVFCCFNSYHKILPATFDGWMRILKQVDGSVLWLASTNPAAMRNLRREAEARGVAQERLVFANRVSMADHLARQHAADLSLDTLPFNAHTTASDALWAGLPILTCMGGSYAGRVAASLLHAAGLPELVTATQVEYEARAIALATQPGELQKLRDRLRDDHATMLLFDSARFTRHMEDLYKQMAVRHDAGLPPQDIESASLP